MTTALQLVRKRWRYCDILQNDRLPYGNHCTKQQWIVAEVKRPLSVVDELEAVANLHRAIRSVSPSCAGRFHGILWQAKRIDGKRHALIQTN